MWLHSLPGLSVLSVLILAILLGILVRNTIGIPPACQPGIRFSLRYLLRLAIVLLGLRLSMVELMAIGPIGLAIIVAASASTFGFTCWLGARLGIRPKLVQLIAAGTSICGASAVVATNAVVNSSEEDLTYAVAMVTGFGTLAMLLYPVLPGLLQLNPEAFGMWCGASIHEVAQVLAAAFQYGPVSGEFATVAKLSRVLMLVPLVLLLGWRSTTGAAGAGQRRSLPIPWFIVLFALLVLTNSLGIIPLGLKTVLLHANQLFLAMAMAAMGLETNLHILRQAGMKPIYLAAAAWLFLAVVSFGLIVAYYGSAQMA